MKVYGWTGSYPNNMSKPERYKHRLQARCVVAARSIAEVAKITGWRRSDLWNIEEAGNKAEIEVALAAPGVVFYQDDLNHTPGEKVFHRHPYFFNPHGGEQ